MCICSHRSETHTLRNDGYLTLPMDLLDDNESWILSSSLRFTCYSCTQAHDLAVQLVRHALVVAMPCAKCAMPLSKAEPTQRHVGPHWMRNTRHRHPRGRCCLRCIRLGPHRVHLWSLTLRTVCRDWRSLPANSVLYIVIYNLGVRTLCKVALFGRFHVSSRPL